MLCKAAVIRVTPPPPEDYVAGTITLLDIRLIRMLIPTPQTSAPSSSLVASASTSAPSFDVASSSSSSANSVSSPERDIDMMLPHPPRALPVTPFDMSDQERPDRPSVVSNVPCSNRIRSHIAAGFPLPSSSRRPTARQGIPASIPPPTSSTPLFFMGSQPILAHIPTAADPAAATAAPLHISAVPMVSPSKVSSPPVTPTPAEAADPICPPSPIVPPPPPSAPATSSAAPLPTDPIPMLDALVQILRTLA